MLWPFIRCVVLVVQPGVCKAQPGTEVLLKGFCTSEILLGTSRRLPHMKGGFKVLLDVFGPSYIHFATNFIIDHHHAIII